MKLSMKYSGIHKVSFLLQQLQFANQVPLKKNLICLNSMSFFEIETSNWDTPQQINLTDDPKSIIPVTSQNGFRFVNYT